MIQRKQPVTKQYLLSFKSGHGDFYQKFVNIIQGKVHFCRQVKQHQSCPPYMISEKCLFMCILQKKHTKYHNQEFKMEELAEILKKYRPQIQRNIENQKTCILKKIKNLQCIQQAILQIITRQNFSFNSFQLQENTYVYELFKAIFNRSEQLSIFGQAKYQPMPYSSYQILQLSAIFDESIILFDYNLSKAAPQINFKHQTTYILKVKNKYAILYVKQPKFIEIINQGDLSVKQIEQIFAKQQVKAKEISFLDKLLGAKGSDQDKLRMTSKLFPDQIQCSKCNNKYSQFDCLKWNYEYCCGSCLQNPRLDTSNIPSTLIEKYFQERGIKHGDYQINCAECTSKTRLLRYNPAYKPQKYKCQVCEHTICLQHGSNIYQCFCQCNRCKVPTFNVLKLNIAVCQNCKTKYCRSCKKSQVQYCNCICKLCNQLNQQGHVCRQRCHYCFNVINKLKQCTCQRKICYGCYYYLIKKYGKCTNQGKK